MKFGDGPGALGIGLYPRVGVTHQIAIVVGATSAVRPDFDGVATLQTTTVFQRPLVAQKVPKRSIRVHLNSVLAIGNVRDPVECA
jgi:hypothetical protein